MCASTILSIGTFDGVHRGHQALIARARQVAGADGRVVILSFDPHPQALLRPESAPARLTTFEQRRSLLINIGADEVRRLEPTRDLLAQTAEQFIETLLLKFNPRAFVEGPDFGFGRDRAGTVQTLRDLGACHDFEVHVLDPVPCVLTDQSVVKASSTLLRWMIRHGRVRDAQAICERPYELTGPVVMGDQRGRDLGTPTANLKPDDLLLPRDGIYAGVGIRPDGLRYPAAISVGTKPTFGDRPRTCEAYLIGYDGPLDDYNWNLRLQFTDWIRDQITFAGVEPLIEQIHRDIATVVTIVEPITTATIHA